MKKIFISQPMDGKTDEEILREREKAVESVKKQLGEEVEVIDSFFQDAPHDARPLWFLGKSLELLSTADIAYFVKGWENARGCKIENECAVAYGIDVIEDYSGATDMKFGTALELLKNGRKVARKGWNRGELYVAYHEGHPPHFQIKRVGQPARIWDPSIRDMMAEDWFIPWEK